MNGLKHIYVIIGGDIMFMFCSLIRHKFGTLLHRLLNICAGLTECAG